MADKFSNVAGYIFIFSFISIIVLFFVSVIIASSNNYMFIKVHNISEEMVSNNVLANSTANQIESSINNFQNGIRYIDYFWLLSFLSMVASSFFISYRSEREGYFGILSWVVFGSLILLFVGGIFLDLTNWFKEEIFSVTPSMLDNLPIFNFYLENLGLINLIVLGVNILLNFSDLGLERFKQKKEPNVGSGEL